MPMQHTENLFRRYKGQLVIIKTISGGIYEGRVNEITNDFVGLIEKGKGEPAQVERCPVTLFLRLERRCLPRSAALNRSLSWARA